jgi:hypothetical protein
MFPKVFVECALFVGAKDFRYAAPEEVRLIFIFCWFRLLTYIFMCAVQE